MDDMDDIDDLVRRTAPQALGLESTNATEARKIAHAVAADRRPRRSKLRTGLWAAIFSVGLVGVGTTAAVAGPALLDWVGFTPDVVVQRTFELRTGNDELGLCTVVARVSPEYGGELSDVEVDERTQAARKFLADYDWDPFVAAITAEDIEAEFNDQQAERQALKNKIEAGGGDSADVPDAEHGIAASSLVGDEMLRLFEEAGYLDGGVSLEMAGHCGDETPGSSE